MSFTSFQSFNVNILLSFLSVPFFWCFIFYSNNLKPPNSLFLFYTSLEVHTIFELDPYKIQLFSPLYLFCKFFTIIWFRIHFNSKIGYFFHCLIMRYYNNYSFSFQFLYIFIKFYFTILIHR